VPFSNHIPYLTKGDKFPTPSAHSSSPKNTNTPTSLLLPTHTLPSLPRRITNRIPRRYPHNQHRPYP